MRLKAKFALTLTFLFISLLFASPVKADSPTVGDVSKELVCQCGCNMVLSNCNHVGCASVEAMTASIEQQIVQGGTKDQIIQFFVELYGEQVLSSPTKRGFNLTAWVLPFGALLIGGIIVYIALRAWVRQGRRPQGVEVEAEEGNEEYQHRLEKELKEFTER